MSPAGDHLTPHPDDTPSSANGHLLARYDEDDSPRPDSDLPMDGSSRRSMNTTPGGPHQQQQGSSSASTSTAKKGVRQLTDAQLEKKRANDREAQRAIRERTKKQIGELEQRIQDLESGEAYRQLQALVEQKKGLEAENYDLKNRLSAVMEILRPVVGSAHLQNLDPASSTPTSTQFSNFNRPLPPPRDPFNAQQNPYDGRPIQGSAAEDAAIAASLSDNNRNNMFAAGHYETPISPFLQTPISTVSTPADTTGKSPFLPSTTDDQQQPLGATNTSLKRKRNSPGESNLRPNNAPLTQNYASKPEPPHARLPLNIAPTCRLDQIIYDFAEASRRELGKGHNLTDIVGPAYCVFNSMIDSVKPSMHEHPLAELIILVLKGFSEISGLPEKIATISGMFIFLRWYIAPSAETFEVMPEWLQPTDEQLQVPHPIWIDYLPWPPMRARMVYLYPNLPLDDFFLPFCPSIAVDFPPNLPSTVDPRASPVGRDLASCLYKDPGTEELRAQPALDDVWMRLESWSVGRDFVEALPDMEGLGRVRGE